LLHDDNFYQPKFKLGDKVFRIAAIEEVVDVDVTDDQHDDASDDGCASTTSSPGDASIDAMNDERRGNLIETS